MGSDLVCASPYSELYISIHAPAWGATDKTLGCRDNLLISIHAPAWGATSEKRRKIETQRYFNPRSRMGSDKETRPEF